MRWDGHYRTLWDWTFSWQSSWGCEAVLLGKVIAVVLKGHRAVIFRVWQSSVKSWFNGPTSCIFLDFMHLLYSSGQIPIRTWFLVSYVIFRWSAQKPEIGVLLGVGKITEFSSKVSFDTSNNHNAESLSNSNFDSQNVVCGWEEGYPVPCETSIAECSKCSCNLLCCSHSCIWQSVLINNVYGCLYI